MTDLTGKIALVTGSARGIGKAIAERFGSRGASIVVNYARDRERANATVDSIERLGRLDIVVANAGVELVDRQVVDVSEADFDRLFGVNADRRTRSSSCTRPTADRVRQRRAGLRRADARDLCLIAPFSR